MESGYEVGVGRVEAAAERGGGSMGDDGGGLGKEERRYREVRYWRLMLL